MTTSAPLSPEIDSKINVVIFASGFDTGGQGFRLKTAFDRFQPAFSVRSVHSSQTYFDYPSDLHYKPAESYEIMAKAHVIHMRNSLAGLKRLRGSHNREPFGLVLHHHGSKFREEHKQVWAQNQAAGAFQVASTIDLTLLERDVAWLPSPFDIEELMSLRLKALQIRPIPEKWTPATPFRVAHAPTDRVKKSTAILMEAILELNRRGIPTVLDLIERRSHADCLARKAKADVYFDQLHLGYGNNAVEAWGMVMPVVAGVDDGPIKVAMEWRWGALPFYQATEATVADRLEELATDSDLRAHWATIGYQHALQYHDYESVAGLLAGYYRQTLAAPAIASRMEVRALL